MVVESETPETNMLIEMELATRSLEQVVESVQNAAQLCTNCGVGIVENAPIVAAMATQAEALQEMLEAQVEVIQENVEVAAVAETPVKMPCHLNPKSKEDGCGLISLKWRKNGKKKSRTRVIE
jgi:hypothetical protein